jgi:hypothetical protein
MKKIAKTKTKFTTGLLCGTILCPPIMPDTLESSVTYSKYPLYAQEYQKNAIKSYKSLELDV